MAQINMDTSVVRKYEKIADDYVEWMNLKEHVSECALINLQSRKFRPTTDEEVAETRNRNLDFAYEVVEEVVGQNILFAFFQGRARFAEFLGLSDSRVVHSLFRIDVYI
jgi:hypothetical protein